MLREERCAIRTAADLFAHDETLDREVCGIPLADPGRTRLGAQGAHDPTPTPYFVLQRLFSQVTLDDTSHLLDVGCGMGRVLAYFLRSKLPGRATGIELDPTLVQAARSWTAPYGALRVLQGDVLACDLSEYTHFYLFNPFDANVLQRFIAAIEDKLAHPCTVVHMSDNGDSWWYANRAGWTELAAGEFSSYFNERGKPVPIYRHPQHYTIWRYEPPA